MKINILMGFILAAIVCFGISILTKEIDIYSKKEKIQQSVKINDIGTVFVKTHDNLNLSIVKTESGYFIIAFRPTEKENIKFDQNDLGWTEIKRADSTKIIFIYDNRLNKIEAEKKYDKIIHEDYSWDNRE
jgi:hypothetical protein